MYKQTVVLLYLFINLVEGQRLFANVNRIAKTNIMAQWKQLAYDFNGVKYIFVKDSRDTARRWTPEGIYFKEEYLEEREMFFKQYNNVLVGFDRSGDKLFLTVPRLRYGIPSTLNYYTNKRGASTVLKPYPDVNSIPSFVSIHRPEIDECNRLWLVDTGLLDIPDNPVQLKQPEIIIFDLKADKEILRYKLKPSDLSNGTTSGLTSITVDVTKTTCEDAHAYINDCTTGGLIVFSLRKRDSWRFTHPTFNYDEGASFILRNNVIDWHVGIFSIALSDPDGAGIRTAYYHPFLSTEEFSITTDVLKNKNGNIEKSFKLVGVRGPWSQSGIHVYDSATRNLFFANIAKDGIQCWNTDKPLKPKNTALIVHDHRWLAFITDMKIRKGYLYVMSNKMDVYINSNLNTTGVNYALLWAKTTDLIKDTVCAA